jgi:trehalose 6-phosphate synthase/phosphatase
MYNGRRTTGEAVHAMANKKLIIISNRLPISVAKVGGKLVYSSSTGGLATAMSSLGDDQGDMAWVGWPGIASDELTSTDRAQITKRLRQDNCYPVFLTRQQVAKFYEGYANDTLWPLFHYFQSIAQYRVEYWDVYRQVNALFKKTAARLIIDGAAVWIQDYHLMLLPKMLRDTYPRLPIGFFLHIPFPSYEIFRLLPNRREILEGLLGADLVGFHIYDYVRHFLSSCVRILGVENNHGTITYGGRTTTADAFPIGIDYLKFVEMLDSPEVLQELRLLEDHYHGQKTILSMDRLDYSKGIMKRLEAFEQFLADNPRYHKKVTMIMIAVPSRTEVDAYRDLRDTVEQTVSRINGTFGQVDWTPISYQYKNLPFEQILPLLAFSDVALVTPLRDGMNLVAKEYVAAKQKRAGVLVLSEMAGAIDELPEALRVNPNDIRSIAGALQQALKVPKKEQMYRLRTMQRRLSDYTVQKWAADFMEQLDDVTNTQKARQAKLLVNGRKQALVHAFQQAKHRLICLDYDGTLRNFVGSPDPNAAKPSFALRTLLRQLADMPNTKVCVVSGRPREVLQDWFKGLSISLAAEHGAWVRDSEEWSQEQATFQSYKKQALPVMKKYAERTPGAEIEEKTFAVVWHYRKVPTELAYARNAGLRHELNVLFGNTEIGVFNGNKIIEVKPRNIHKGFVVSDMLAMHPSDFVLCAGDDYTDEDMFEHVPDDAYSIKVGPGDTRANYQIESIEKLLALLRSLVP